MNIVFLSSESAHHFYLINEVHRYHPVKKVFFQTIYEERKSWSEKIKKWAHPKNYGTAVRILLERALFGREEALEERFEREYFFGGQAPSLNSGIPAVKVRTFNDERTVELVATQAPDLIIVFGTEILKGKILRTAKLHILNIHRGILPKYRGGGMPAWVFYNNDFRNIGTTVHVCSEKLDAGDIVGQKFYQLQKNDRTHMLRGKTTVLAAEILNEVIDKIKKGALEYQKQELLTPWSVKDLTLGKRLAARRNFNRYIRTLTH